MKQLQAEVLSNDRVLEGLDRPHGRGISGTYVMRLRAPDIAHQARPGQFVMVRCGDCVLPRPFSIYRRDGDVVSFLYDVWEEGKGTTWLSERCVANQLSILGPLGNGFDLTKNDHNILLIAGGTGIAPLMFLADEAMKIGKHVLLLAGAANVGHLLPTGMIPSGLETFYSTDDGTAGLRGMITDLLPKHAKRADQIMACGPLKMYKTMALNADEFGLIGKTVQISVEEQMGCGTGVCYGCTIRTKKGLKQVCQDGPVFELSEIVWDNLTGV